MSGNKAALKAAKASIDKEQWNEAVTQAEVVLASDHENYFARLFLGRALEKQGKLEDAAKTYHSAAKSKPDDAQAWLGLCSLYEAQGAQKLDDYGECAVQVAVIYGKADDKHRCQTTIDKLTSLAKKVGTTSQYKRALQVLLPSSPVYEHLEGRIPHPSHTFTRLAEITEDEEKQRINREIGERRTRLGARIGQVTSEVKNEVYSQSDLEGLYQGVIDWAENDDLRREYEEKLLQRAYDVLVVMPRQYKDAKRQQVTSLSQGMVIIKHPFRVAWDVELEWRDVSAIQEYDVNVLYSYSQFFPESGLSKVLRAYLRSEISPFPEPKKEDDEEEDEVALSSENRLLLMGEGLGDGKGSPLAHRLVAEYYLYLEENESAIETSRNGLRLLNTEAQRAGLELQENKDALNAVLATALVYHQAPRHHPEAKTILDDIVTRKPKSTSALIGLGFISEEQEKYSEAVDLLSKALEQDCGNARIATEAAWCKALFGDFAEALKILEEHLPDIKTDNPKSRDLRAQTLYRIGICQWELDTSKAARKDRNGAYAVFLSAIKTNPNFAPAYTSLGFYYADYAKDKKRARQCFQKAFELSASEVIAAERLARSFADKGEWDIVEIVSQRVIDSGKVRPPPGSKKKGISWPFSALGVVDMTRQEYAKAIPNFLQSLRISPDDYYSYVGLGESYHNSGRYNSASRTFEYAEAPHDGIKMKASGEKWFTEYMLANVHRELGEHEAAIIGLEKVLQDRPEEFGALMALLQTYVEKAWQSVETGFFGQAAESARLALELAGKIAKLRPAAFNVWKAVGDACSVFFWTQEKAELFSFDTVRDLMLEQADMQSFEVLADIDGVGPDVFDPAPVVNGEASARPDPNVLRTTLLAYKRAIHCASQDIHAQAVAWYNLGWAEHQAYHSGDQSTGRKFLKAAVRCFKRSIELEAGNSEFWNALGVVTTKLNPSVAQHSFVRSLHLNERSAPTWTNLGTLYLINKDYELAHQAFGRAQSTDPDYAHAWLGEGIIALMMDDGPEALSHFTHAVEISDSASHITKRQFGISVLDHILSQPSSPLTPNLIQPIFALRQLQSLDPSNQSYTHLLTLFQERVADHDSAKSSLSTLCTTLESDYESTESASTLSSFARAKADLARNQLASHDYTSATENAETALDLSSDLTDTSVLSSDARHKLRLSAHLTLGLSNFFTFSASRKDESSADKAIASFRSALEESDSDPDVICLLAQVLYAKSGSAERGVARDQLLSTIETDGNGTPHVGALTLLGAMLALDQGDELFDQDTLEAIVDDLKGLRASEKISRAQRVRVGEVLACIAALRGEEGEEMSEVQTQIVLAPNDSSSWGALADMDDGEDSGHAAQMALLNATRSVPPFGGMEAGDLAKAYARTGTVGDAQRAVMLAPWRKEGWESFAEAVTA